MASPLLMDLLAEIEQGRYAIPEIQRPYVWTNPQVKELFESIYKGYPIGSIIVWKPASEIFEEYGDLFGALSKELEDRKRNFEYVVIDGQQRLLSLWLVKKGKITVVDTYGQERERTINLYYHVDNDEFFVDRARRSLYSTIIGRSVCERTEILRVNSMVHRSNNICNELQSTLSA